MVLEVKRTVVIFSLLLLGNYSPPNLSRDLLRSMLMPVNKIVLWPQKSSKNGISRKKKVYCAKEIRESWSKSLAIMPYL